MKRLPFVSVIVPALNEERYIENCLKALKNQDYKGKYEIIVADGMSKDKTVEIAKKYADKVIIVKKRGIAAERNAGAKIAKGEIFLFIDADTIASFNLIREIAKVFKKNVVGATCHVLPLSPSATDFILYWFYNQFAKFSIKIGKPQIAGCCCAYKREAFEKIGGFNEKLKTLEDFDISRRISKKLGKIKFINSAFVLTSPRRIKKWGKTKAAKKYVKLYVNYLLRKSVGIDEYKPIR
jgi:cellulose synthase/poly-beta-1,6-N-acetylglucosamine synthase-like glycosyltransferase